MQELWKRRGATDETTSFRGILIANTAAKALGSCIRPRFMKIADKIFLQTQHGGVKYKGVDMTTHLIRMFSEDALARHASHAVVFVDASNAFYSVARQLTVPHLFSDTTIAQIAATFNLPHSALHELYKALDEPILLQAGASTHTQHLAAELFQETWFAVQH